MENYFLAINNDSIYQLSHPTLSKKVKKDTYNEKYVQLYFPTLMVQTGRESNNFQTTAIASLDSKNTPTTQHVLDKIHETFSTLSKAALVK